MAKISKTSLNKYKRLRCGKGKSIKLTRKSKEMKKGKKGISIKKMMEDAKIKIKIKTKPRTAYFLKCAYH
jgi:hypothetical protein